MSARIAQTFIVDPATVNLAEVINITSVELYFKKKPLGIGNKSGSVDPGVSVYIVPTQAGGAPKFNTLDDYISGRKEFSEIQSSVDASLATKFNMLKPVPIRTGVEYAIIFKPDLEEGYELWAATQGEINVNSKTVNPGLAGKYNGRYFELSTATATWQPLPYKSLKFKANIARYAYGGVIPPSSIPSFTLNMKNYEFVSYNTLVGQTKFLNGEMVFQDKDIADGSCAVVRGLNTATTTGGGFGGYFTPSGDESYIVVKDADKVDVRKVIAISNDENTITVDQPFSFTNTGSDFIRTPVGKAYVSSLGRLINNTDRFMIIADSTANSTVYFSNNSLIIGEESGAVIANAYFNDIIVHNSEAHIYINAPSGTSFSTKQVFGYTTTNDQDGILSAPPISFDVALYEAENVGVGKPVVLKSRSNEVTLRNWSSSVPSESSKILFSVQTTNDFMSPQIDYNATDVFFKRYIINNSAVNEHTKNGSALSKHITTKVNFKNNRQAEDVIVFLQAYKPAGTDIKVYVKLYNSEDSDYYDDKDWTLLEEKTNAGFSSSSNLSDFKEYEYGLSMYPEAEYTIPGRVAIQPGNNIIVGISTDFTDNTTGLLSGDLIKIYPELFPENYIITSVGSIDSATQITLDRDLEASEVAATGSVGLKIDKIKYKHQAFLNKNNNNTVRYFNSNMTIIDKFDTFACKIVFLSGSQFIIPKVSNIRAIGVSA